jgi:tetratricopeptide (TPR) repeat protein
VLQKLLISVLLVAATLAVYTQVYKHEFITFDDRGYISDNDHVRQGLSADGAAWAFTTYQQGNWHPLTWLSHMADAQLFRSVPPQHQPGCHHLMSVALHILSTLLLFLALSRLTGCAWRSGLVAALFALHPLHVESVAWAAERKDVLSGLFMMLTLLAYAWYARRPNVWRYLPVAAFLALGLMAKPMLVTVPLVLLLLDYWPLRRLDLADPRRWRRAGWLVLEKVPLLALSVASGLVTVAAQKAGGAVAGIEILPLGQRVANALVAYVTYMAKTVWPTHLAFFYPYPEAIPVWQWAGAAALLVLITILVVRAGRRYPYLPVGWFWYLGMLVPVIGLVQVGEQSLADRYTYLPLIGLFIAVVWGVAEAVAALRLSWVVAAGAAVVAVAGCLGASYVEVGYWSDSIELYTRALDVTEKNHVAHNSLGFVLLSDPRFLDMATQEFRDAIVAQPAYAEAHSNLALALVRKGRLKDAEAEAREALRLNPFYAQAAHNLGNILIMQNRLTEAEDALRQATRLRPAFAEAHNDLGYVLQRQGKMAEAVQEFRHAVADQPGYAVALSNLGSALTALGRYPEAIQALRQAVAVAPDYAKAHSYLALALADAGQVADGIAEYRLALDLNPDFVGAMGGLAWVLATDERAELRSGEEAVRLASRACALSGNQEPLPLDALAAAYAESGKFLDAIAKAREAEALALARGDRDLAAAIRNRLALYESRRPYRQARPAPPPAAVGFGR